MKLRSFRLRIALLSALLAGSALAVFGVASWFLIYDAKLKQLDEEIKNQLLLSLAPHPHTEDYWQSYNASLSSALGLSSHSAIALFVIHRSGLILYQSETWSSAFRVNLNFPPPPDITPRFSRGERQLPPELPPRTPPNVVVVTRSTHMATWRVGTIASPRLQVAIAINLKTIDAEMGAIGRVFWIAIPLVLALVAIGAWILSGRALAPLRDVTATIQRITVKGLDQRVVINTVDLEFIELLQVFNQMMERLEHSFKQASRFSADAAHELKTPLAILQGELERTLQQVESGSDLQQRLSNLLDEVRRLSEIVRKLLLLSLADAGQMKLHLIEVNLSQLLMDLIEDIDLLAPHLTIESKITPVLCLMADRDLLIQILQNLVNNAIKYNLPNGWIRLEAFRQSSWMMVKVSNRSQPIAEVDRDRIFDRFYRGDPAHTRQIEGLGLGLSLSREIARAHGGDLRLDASLPAQTTLILTLPAKME